MFACHVQFSVVMLTMQVNLEIKFMLWIQQVCHWLNNEALYRAWQKAWNIPACIWDK